MGWKLAAAASSLSLFLFSTTWAQQTQSASPSMTEVTKFQPLPSSMETLLNNGWQIVSIGAGLGGYAYLLKNGKKWITCAIAPSTKLPTMFISQCMAMN